jgi:phosphoribosylformylglycinamidine cyclo-ligase
VEKSEIIDGIKIAPGDAVLGVASSGPHSNGFSLIRKVVETSGATYDDAFGNGTLGATLMAPTRIYSKQVLAVNQHVRIRGMAHITGGGLLENVPRVLPAACQAVIYRDTWKRPANFDWLQAKGGIDEEEMYRVFNCGIGLVVVVGSSDADRALAQFKTQGEQAWKIGTIKARPAGALGCIVL